MLAGAEAAGSRQQAQPLEQKPSVHTKNHKYRAEGERETEMAESLNSQSLPQWLLPSSRPYLLGLPKQ